MLYAIVTVLVLILDQAVKYWVTVGIKLNEGVISVIPGVLSLVNIHNSGAAFGILEGGRWIFVLLAAVFVAVVVFAISKNVIRQPFGRWSAVLVMAGAIGNCIDRVINGYVVDMFRLDFINFAVFNVADILITVCGILFCAYIIMGEDFKGAPASTDKPKADPKAAAVKSADAAAKLPEATPAPKTPAPAAKKDDVPRAAAPAPKPAAPAAKPVTAPAPVSAPSTAPAARTDDLAEWRAIFEDVAEPARAQDAPKETAVSIESGEVYAQAPVEAPVKKDDMDFTLEDILAEYSSK